MKWKTVLAIVLALTLYVTGCSTENGNTVSTENSVASETENEAQSSVDPSEMFTDRDMEIGYDESTGTVITLSDEGMASDSETVQISDRTVTITDEGTYILSGKLTDGMIIVEAEDTDKIQLVLDGVEITSSESAAIYVRSADKVFLTTAPDSVNVLANGGVYTAIDDNNIDAVIFAKSDLTLNGAGILKITSPIGHGVVSKDDLILTSGTFEITADAHGLSGKDSVRCSGGTFTILSGKDGIQADNEDDASLGFVYLAGGNFNISADDDGIHANYLVTITGGIIEIVQSYEGIEGLGIDISGGEITLTASDDGLNAAGGSDSSGFAGAGGGQFAAEEGAYINISGGILKINASGDGIDSNGDLAVSGGETYVSGPTNNGNGSMDYNGEAIISGGILVAAGSSGMAQNFGDSSTQGVILVTMDAQAAGSTVSLSDSSGNILVSWDADKEYSSVLISCPEIAQGQEYTLTAGSYTEQVTMDSLVYGSGGMGGGPGSSGQMNKGRIRSVPGAR